MQQPAQPQLRPEDGRFFRGRFHFVVAVIAVIVACFLSRLYKLEAVMKALTDKLEADKKALTDTQRIMSYPNFTVNMRQAVANLGATSAHIRYLAAERLLVIYPQCAPCLYVLSDASLTLQGFDEAFEASKRLVELTPHNSLAIEMHDECLDVKGWFDKEAREQQEKLLGLPDDRVHHRWAPFTELPENLGMSHSTAVLGLQQMWRSVKTQDPELAEDITQIVQRQWAVETGRVENLYILSEGATQSLIVHGISANAITSDPARSMGIDEGTEDVGMIEDILMDQKRVVESLAERVITTQKLNITKDLLFDLQLAFTATAKFTEVRENNERVRVLVRRGRFKNQPNFPMRNDGRFHQYCPFLRVNDEIERLLSLTEKYEAQGIAPEVLAAWLHHRFVQIHPFHDGNGRVARSIASLVLMKGGLLPFTVRLRDRRSYFHALETANQGNLDLFVDFIVRQQRETLLSALSWAGTRASHITSEFENMFPEEKLTSLKFKLMDIQNRC